MPTLWPYYPKIKYDEYLLWNTDVIPTESSEGRIAVGYLRQELKYTFLVDDAELASIVGRISNQTTEDWYIPVWSEASFAGNVLSADTVVSADTNGDYRVAGLALVANQTTQVVKTIQTVGASSITFDSPVGEDVSEAVIVPLRTAFVRGNVSIGRVSGNVNEVSLTFQVRDNEENPNSPFVQYQSLDVMTDNLTGRGELDEDLTTNITLIDNEMGIVALERKRTFVSPEYTLMFVDSDLESKWRRKRWIHSLRGRDKPFWFPDVSAPIRTVTQTGSGSTTVTINALLADPTHYVGRHIMVGEDATLCREITDAIVSGSNHVITIDSAFGSVIPANTPLRFLYYVRLDTDSVKIAHSDARHASMRMRLEGLTL